MTNDAATINDEDYIFDEVIPLEVEFEKQIIIHLEDQHVARLSNKTLGK